MRARQMLNKLDRLGAPVEEPKWPDLTVLSPADQDRVLDLFQKNRNSLRGLQPGISVEEFEELQAFLAIVPMKRLDEPPSLPRRDRMRSRHTR
jgi:hypothetical protein